ncbi:mannosyltransferase [Hypoxylon texense]
MPSHQHNHLHRRDGIEGVVNPLQEREPATVYLTVYETMSATFDGPIAGYSTLGKTADDAKTQPAATPTQDAQPNTATESPAKAADTTAKAVDTTAVAAAQVENTSPVSSAKETTAAESSAAKSTSLPGEIVATGSVDLSEHSTLAVATSTPTTLVQATKNLDTSKAASATSAAASSSSTATADSSSTDTSGAAKAGIAIGVLGGILVVGLLIFLLFSKRRKQLEKQRSQDDEKINGPMSGRPASLLSTKTSATAPQLSVRPITQFMPNFGERRSSKGAALALATGAASNANAENSPRSPWERPSTSHANNPENPFGNNAERAYTPTNDQPRNPFENPENVVGVATTTNSPPKSAPLTGAASAGAGAVAGAAAAAAVTRQASTRKNAPAPLDLTIPAGPPSPAGTEFSVHSVAPGQSPGPSRSAMAIAEAGGPASSAVHRVQLDFKPTLDDEMGLRAGQLVRLLHEYDDGWSLCIRLDRTQQGVVPRTCLSTRPVKPRPAGGPPGARNGPPVNPSGPRGPRGPGPNYPPGQRPMTPQNGRPESPMMRPMTAGRPQSPAMMRPQSPANGRPMSPYGGRPASPATGRPMSPGPRAQSPGPRQQRRMTPPGPSPMNPSSGPPQQQQGPVGRKPVPGQAY